MAKESPFINFKIMFLGIFSPKNMLKKTFFLPSKLISFWNNKRTRIHSLSFFGAFFPLSGSKDDVEESLLHLTNVQRLLPFLSFSDIQRDCWPFPAQASRQPPEIRQPL
jgi:hypothetical protein